VALFGRTGGQALKGRHESRKAYGLQEMRRQVADRDDIGALVYAIPRARWAEEKNTAEDELIHAALAGVPGLTQRWSIQGC